MRRSARRSAESVRRMPAARHCSTAWSQPARENTNTIAGSIRSSARRSTTSVRHGVYSRRRRCPRPRGALRASRRAATGFGCSSPPVVDERRQQVQLLGAAVADHVQVHEVDRPALLDHRLGRAPHRLHPRRDLLGVRHGRRQRHDVDLGGQVDDDLLPHRAARRVLEVVHLVEHDVAQAVERRRARVDHVAQHFGGHHHDRRVAVDRVVAGEQADAGRRRTRGRSRRTSGSTAPSAASCRRPCRPSRARGRSRTRRRASCPSPSARRRAPTGPASSASSARVWNSSSGNGRAAVNAARTSVASRAPVSRPSSGRRGVVGVAGRLASRALRRRRRRCRAWLVGVSLICGERRVVRG